MIKSDFHEFVLGFSAFAMTIACIVALYGVNMLFNSSNKLGFEGWYLIGYSVLYSSVLWLPAFIYLAWPKPELPRAFRYICSVPFLVMVVIISILTINSVSI